MILRHYPTYYTRLNHAALEESKKCPKVVKHADDKKTTFDVEVRPDEKMDFKECVKTKLASQKESQELSEKFSKLAHD